LTYRDFTIRHWDFERQRETTTPLSLPLRFRAKYPVSDVVSVGHRERLVISSREHLHIIDAATGEVLRQMKVPRC
jgi:hypothetical protein